MLATPCAARPNDGFMQPRHKVSKVVDASGRYAAVKPLLCCKVIQAADELDGHLELRQTLREVEVLLALYTAANVQRWCMCQL